MIPENASAAELTALLGRDADLQLKARACQQLALVGDASAVPALASLLAHPQLSARARTALEAIPSPAAAEALRGSLATLQGELLAGVVDSLAVLRDVAAVPALIRLAQDAASGALAALGHIADPLAVAEIRRQLAGPAAVPAAHAALRAAQVLLREGNRPDAFALLDALPAAGLPAFLHTAAHGLRWNAEAVPLLDGMGFAGWEGDLAWFRVFDRTVIAGSRDKPVPHNEFLVFEKDFADFELRLQVRIPGGEGNGGIQFRSQRVAGSREMSGYQADAAPGYWGGLYDESRRNRFLGTRCPAEALAAVLRPTGWNDYTILCEGPRVRLWINGLLTTDFTETDGTIPRSGKIGLQIHSGPPAEIHYRKLRLREIGA